MTASAAAAPLSAGTGLSKACPLAEPFNRARPRQACLIFDLELFDIGGGGPCGARPFLPLPPPPPVVLVGRQARGGVGGVGCLRGGGGGGETRPPAARPPH